MRYLLLLLKFLLILSDVAFADVYFKTDFGTDKKNLSTKFQFYGVPFQGISQTPFQRYCDLSQENAEIYLNNKFEMAKIDATAAYHYGTLIGFAPCLEKNLKSAIYYLKIASDKGNGNAAYLLGIIFSKKNDMVMAKKYFIKAARSFHPEANYNYALLESQNFKYINQITISLLKNAASSGNLKAQHDQSIVILKLFLSNKIKLHKSEIIRLSNVFNNVIDTTSDIQLKAKAKQNLHNFISLTKQLVVTQNIKKTKTINNNINKNSHHKHIAKAKENINFARLEQQSMAIFDDYQNFSNNINR
jgi:hypothetical protein